MRRASGSNRVHHDAKNIENRAVTQRRIVAVVDDDPSMLRAAASLLDALGFATETFASAEDFLDHCDTSQVDVLLLDINLGGISGIELQHRLAASNSVLPVIFMTAIDDELLRGEALRSGCIACLRKPFQVRCLMDAIERIPS